MNMADDNKRVVGSYATEDEAVETIERLKAEGYRAEDISVISKNRDDLDAVSEETGTKTEEGLAAGAAAGGALGGLTGLLVGIGALAIPGIGPIVAAGPIAATLTGAAVGAGAGGLAGALIGMGIPEEEANRYEAEVKEGRILILVDPDDRNRDRLTDDETIFTGGAVNDARRTDEDFVGTTDRNTAIRATDQEDRYDNYIVDPLNPGELDKGENAFQDHNDQNRPYTDENIDPNTPLSDKVVSNPFADEDRLRDEVNRDYTDPRQPNSDYPKG
jgi:uncharacterized membrane protein